MAGTGSSTWQLLVLYDIINDHLPCVFHTVLINEDFKRELGNGSYLYRCTE